MGYNFTAWTGNLAHKMLRVDGILSDNVKSLGPGLQLREGLGNSSIQGIRVQPAHHIILTHLELLLRHRNIEFPLTKNKHGEGCQLATTRDICLWNFRNLCLTGGMAKTNLSATFQL